MTFRRRVRGLLLGAAAADLRYQALSDGRVMPGVGVPGDDDASVPAATRLLRAAVTSLVEWDGFDGPDQARQFVDAVTASPQGGFTVLERLVAGMLCDGADWSEPAVLLARTVEGQSHDAALRGLVAAIVSVDNKDYRSWLAERLVGLTHRSPGAVAAGILVADVAASLLRGEDVAFQAGHEPLRARSVADPGAVLSACAVDVVRSIVAVEGSTPGVVDALESLRYCWWADGRVAVLTGALAGARHGTAAIPAAWMHPVVDAEGLVAIGDELATRGDGYTSAALRSTV